MTAGETRAAPPLISSQLHLDRELVLKKVRTFRVFAVSTVLVEMRGRVYRVLVDGHHNLAAARLAGVEPTWRGPSLKLRRLMKKMGPAAFARMLINNLTDSEWRYIDTGEVVPELLGLEKEAQQ